jgi:hypothetical protein
MAPEIEDDESFDGDENPNFQTNHMIEYVSVSEKSGDECITGISLKKHLPNTYKILYDLMLPVTALLHVPQVLKR